MSRGEGGAALCAAVASFAPDDRRRVAGDATELISDLQARDNLTRGAGWLGTSVSLLKPSWPAV